MRQFSRNVIWRQVVYLIKLDLYACLALWMVLALPAVCQHGPMPVLFPNMHESLHAGHGTSLASLPPHIPVVTAADLSRSGMALTQSFAHPLTPGDLFLSVFGALLALLPYGLDLRAWTCRLHQPIEATQAMLPPLERPPYFTPAL